MGGIRPKVSIGCFFFWATLPSLQTWIQKKQPSVISILLLSDARRADDEKRLRSEFLLTVLHIAQGCGVDVMLYFLLNVLSIGPSQSAPGQYPNYPQGQGQQYGGYRPPQPGPPQGQQQRPYGYDQVSIPTTLDSHGDLSRHRP